MKLAREVEREHGDKVGLNHIGSIVRDEEEGPLWSSAATGMGDGVPVDLQSLLFRRDLVPHFQRPRAQDALSLPCACQKHLSNFWKLVFPDACPARIQWLRYGGAQRAVRPIQKSWRRQHKDLGQATQYMQRLERHSLFIVGEVETWTRPQSDNIESSLAMETQEGHRNRRASLGSREEGPS